MIETVITQRGIVPGAESIEGVDPTAAVPTPPPPSEPQPIPPRWSEHFVRAKAGSDETLEVYAQARRRVAIDETDGQIRHIVGLLKDALIAMNHPATFRAGLKDAVGIQADYREYVDRARRLGKLLKIKYTPPALPELPSAALLMDRSDCTGGPVRQQIAAALENQRAELARCESDIQRKTRVFDSSAAITEAGRIRPAEAHVAWGSRTSYITKGPVEGWAPDLCIRDLDEAFAEHRRVSDVGVALAQDETKAASVVSIRIKAAVEDAGGVGDVIEMLRDALREDGKWYEPSPDWAAVVTIDKRLAKLDGSLATARSGSPLATSLQNERDTLATDVDTLRETIDQQRRAEILAVLNLALGGDEQGRAAIESIAEQSRAFPPGFYQAVQDASFDRITLNELSNVLTSQ